MVGNPDDLVRVQPRIKGVQHTPRSAHTKIQLEVAVAIPSQRCDAVAKRQIHTIQCIGHLARTQGHIFVGVAVNIAFDTARDHFTLTMVPLGKLNQ